VRLWPGSHSDHATAGVVIVARATDGHLITVLIPQAGDREEATELVTRAGWEYLDICEVMTIPMVRDIAGRRP
jgi:hypothetical protein